MNKLVGYLINGETLPVDGKAYNYIFAGDGVWVWAMNEHINAAVKVADCKIRGLKPGNFKFILDHGRIPQRFWDLALSVMLASPEVERYVGIAWDDKGYRLYMPDQESGETKVKYLVGENIVVEMHSHPDFGPGPSGTDDKDEQGLKIYGIIGELNEDKPAVYLRLGVYGYWQPVKWSDVFEGSLQGAIDVVVLEEKEKEDEK